MEIEATNTANKQEVKSESEVLLSDFAKNLVEQMFVEALEEYQERKRKNVHDKLPISSKTNPGIAGGQSSDWTLDSDGKMNVMVEQTTYVESKPSSSSKKQRRRRDTENLDELDKTEKSDGINISSRTAPKDESDQQELRDHLVVDILNNQNDLVADGDEHNFQIDFKSVAIYSNVMDCSIEKEGTQTMEDKASEKIADRGELILAPSIQIAGHAQGGATELYLTSEPVNLGLASISNATTGGICRSVGGVELTLNTLAQSEQRKTDIVHETTRGERENCDEFEPIQTRDLVLRQNLITIPTRCPSNDQQQDLSDANNDITEIECLKENSSLPSEINDSILASSKIKASTTTTNTTTTSTTDTITEQANLETPGREVCYAATKQFSSNSGRIEAELAQQLNSEAKERGENEQENELRKGDKDVATTSNPLLESMCHDPNSSSIVPLFQPKLSSKTEEKGPTEHQPTGLVNLHLLEIGQRNETEFKDTLAKLQPKDTKQINLPEPSGKLDEGDVRQQENLESKIPQLLLLRDGPMFDDGSSDTKDDSEQGVDSDSQSEINDVLRETCKSALSNTDILDTIEEREDPPIETTHLQQPSIKDCLSRCCERKGNNTSDVSKDEKARLSSSHSDSKELSKLEPDYSIPDTINDKELLGQTSTFTTTTTTTTSSSNISEEDLVEESALAEDVELDSLREKRHSVPEELKTTKHSFLSVEQPDKFLVPNENQSEIEGNENKVFSRKYSDSSWTDRPKSESIEFKDCSTGDNIRRLSGINDAQKYHSEAQENKKLMKKEFGGYNSSKSTPSLNRRSLIQNQNSSNSSQAEDQSSSYATAPLAPSSSSNVEFQSTSASLYETAQSNLTKTSNIEQDLGHSNCTITDSNVNNNNNTNTTSEMANFSVEDKQEVTISSEQYLSPSNVGSPTITPNSEDPEDVEGLTADEEEAIANQTVDLGNSPTPGPSQVVTPKNIAIELRPQQIEQIEMGDSYVHRESLEEDQINRAVIAKRLSEGNNRLSGSFIRKNSLHMVGEMPPLTEGEAIKYSGLSHTSQNVDSATSSTSSGSLRQSKHLREVPKRGSQDGSVSCSSSTSLERSPSKRRGSTVSQCSSVLSEEARNQLNFDLSPDLPLETSLLEANSISSTDLCRPISPEPPLINNEQLDSRPESRLLEEEIICSLSRNITIECSSEEGVETEVEMKKSNPVRGLVTEDTMKSEQETRRDKELDQSLEETDSMIFDDSLNRPGTSSASSFCNDTIIENLPNSNRELSAQLPSNQGRKSVSPTSRIPRASSKNSRSNSANENRRDSDHRIASSYTQGATSTKTSHFSNRSRTLNSPSNISNNDLDKLRSANSTCSSSSSSHSSSRGSPKPQSSRRNQGNENDYRLLNVIKIERKRVLSSQNRRLTSDSSNRSNSELSNKILTNSEKRVESFGHRHGSSNNNPAPLCYCHNY